jgi:D-alanine-D-alanine ligase-like ATP-grasp enzyme
MRKLKAWLYAWVSEKYMHGCSNFNTVEVRRGCRSKAQGRAVFEKNDVPHARGKIFFWPRTAVQFANEHGYPLVIKPNVSGYSRGSYFPIQNKAELYRAIFWAKMWWPTTVIERFLLGSNYRVLTKKTDLISVIRRYSPFVIGNGNDTISQLIEEENRTRKEMELHPTIYPLSKNDKVAAHLKKQNLNFESVPKKDEHIELFHRVALAPGGVVEIIDCDTIPEVNKKLFLQVVEMFGANVLGIDVIFEKGIETPYQDQKCIFIEVNSRPYMKMHYYPRYGKAEELSESLAELEQLNIDDKDIF